MVGVESCRRMGVVETCSQPLEMDCSMVVVESRRRMVVVETCSQPLEMDCSMAVSYTHLTLPTIYSV